MNLADAIADLLSERGPLSAEAVARTLRRRTADVRAALYADPRFTRTGSTKASRWDLVPPGFSTAEAATHWNCSIEMAEELLFGPDGFVERGFVASANGNGRVLVTELGLEVSAHMKALA